MIEPKDNDLVWYIDSKGRSCEGVILSVGSIAGQIETIWFDHPERKGAVKHVHNVPHQGENIKTRCWRERVA